jgi:hypothetical protein
MHCYSRDLSNSVCCLVHCRHLFVWLYPLFCELSCALSGLVCMTSSAVLWPVLCIIGTCFCDSICCFVNCLVYYRYLLVWVHPLSCELCFILSELVCMTPSAVMWPVLCIIGTCFCDFICCFVNCLVHYRYLLVWIHPLSCELSVHSRDLFVWLHLLFCELSEARCPLVTHPLVLSLSVSKNHYFYEKKIMLVASQDLLVWTHYN